MSEEQKIEHNEKGSVKFIGDEDDDDPFNGIPLSHDFALPNPSELPNINDDISAEILEALSKDEKVASTTTTATTSSPPPPPPSAPPTNCVLMQ